MLILLILWVEVQDRGLLGAWREPRPSLLLAAGLVPRGSCARPAPTPAQPGFCTPRTPSFPFCSAAPALLALLDSPVASGGGNDRIIQGPPSRGVNLTEMRAGPLRPASLGFPKDYSPPEGEAASAPSPPRRDRDLLCFALCSFLPVTSAHEPAAKRLLLLEQGYNVRLQFFIVQFL